MIAIDTNLLVYAHRAAVPQHAASRHAIERAATSGAWGFAQASLAEFWAVVTHPESSGRPSTGREAAAFIQALVDAGATVLTPGPDFADRLVQLAVDLSIAGSRVFDLQIALSAMDHGAVELWTHDRHFVQVPGLRVSDPMA